jgi:hypothetical protein
MLSARVQSIRDELRQAFSDLELIDAHEHLAPEPVRLALKIDVFNLFAQYTGREIVRAGLSQDRANRMFDPALPLEERWAIFREYLPFIRQSSFFQAALRTARESYGLPDINDDTYEELSRRMAANNTPGIYHRLLREKCKVRLALTQRESVDYDLSLFRIVMFAATHATVRSWEEIETRAATEGLHVNTLGDYEEVMEAAWDRWQSEGVVGMKVNDLGLPLPDRGEARLLWEKLRAGQEIEWAPLHAYLHDYLYKLCARRSITVAVHTGFFWGNQNAYDVKLALDLVIRYPQTRFDLYHAGLPNIRESAFVAKNYPNVYLNLTWAYLLSEPMVRAGLREWLDLVPVNKIIAFGGDHSHATVDKVVGHRSLALETMATVLAERVAAGRMDEDDALFIAGRWLYDNPVEAYRLVI